MSSEAITDALFLITAVVATAVLISAIYPVISNTAGTFQSSAHQADVTMRTDFKITANFAAASSHGTVDVYLKNVGTQRISLDEIAMSDVFCGTTVGHLLQYDDTKTITTAGYWNAEILHSTDVFWDTGESLHIRAYTDDIAKGDTIYFQLGLPTGAWRSTEFVAS